MSVRPLSPEALARLVAERCRDELGRSGGRVRVAVDAAPAAAPQELAEAVAEELRDAGVAVLRVRAADFLRAASVRLEHGRTDPEAYAQDWLDADALAREVLDPLGPGGSGRYLPSLRDPVTDRPTRAAYELAPERAVLLVDGDLLLGRWLPFDLVVHLDLSAGALRRRTPPEWEWTLPAYAEYAEQVQPARTADLVVRYDDPRHPALVEPD